MFSLLLLITNQYSLDRKTPTRRSTPTRKSSQKFNQVKTYIIYIYVYAEQDDPTDHNHPPTRRIKKKRDNEIAVECILNVYTDNYV